MCKDFRISQVIVWSALNVRVVSDSMWTTSVAGPQLVMSPLVHASVYLET